MMLNLLHLVLRDDLRDNLKHAFDLLLRALKSHLILIQLCPAPQALLVGGNLVAILVLRMIVDFRIVDKPLQLRYLALSLLLVDIEGRALAPLRPRSLTSPSRL